MQQEGSTHLSAINDVNRHRQNSFYTVGIFEGDKSKPSRLASGWIFHNNTVAHLAILTEIP